MAVSSEILATSGQTVVDTTLALPESVSDFLVFVNNVLSDTALYTRTSSSEITFNTPLIENDKIRTLVPFTNPTSCAGNMVFPNAPTLGELYAKVRSEMRVDRRGRIWSNADIKEALNNAILTVQKAANFGWQMNDACQTIQTVAGQETYTLSSDSQGLQLVEYNKDSLYTSGKLEVEALNKTLPTGTPRFYYVYSGALGLSPIPASSNQEIKVYYQKFLVPLDNDTDTLPFPFDFCKTVVLYTAYDLFSQTGDGQNIQRAANKKARYREELNTIRLAYLVPDRNQVRYKTSYIAPSRRSMTKRGRAGRLID